MGAHGIRVKSHHITFSAYRYHCASVLFNVNITKGNAISWQYSLFDCIIYEYKSNDINRNKSMLIKKLHLSWNFNLHPLLDRRSHKIAASFLGVYLGAIDLNSKSFAPMAMVFVTRCDHTRTHRNDLQTNYKVYANARARIRLTLMACMPYGT